VDDSSRAALVQAEVASTAHRFDDARGHLARAARMGGPREAIERHGWRSIRHVAWGSMRCSRRVAESPRRAVGSKIWYRSAPCLPISSASPRRTLSIGRRLTRTTTVSPFPLAWVCFQLGMLWGELVPVLTPILPRVGIRRAIAYLPGYVKARVHLAEIYASQDQTGEAETLLRQRWPVAIRRSSGALPTC
jgi:hypothetical protein